jgi:hypothetical protein
MLVFSYTAPIPLRQRLRIPIMVGVGLLFLVFMGLIGGVGSVLFGIFPVALITAMNICGQRICSNCGKTNHNTNIYAFTPPAYCLQCGTKLDR